MKIFLKRFSVLLLLLAFTVLAGAYLVISRHEREQASGLQEALRAHAGRPTYESIDPDRPIREQTSVFEIAGRVFEMPTVYVQSNLAGRREQPNGVNLIYVLPGYTSRVAFANRDEYERARAERRFGHMMFEPEAVRPSFDTMIQNRKRGIEKEVAIGAWRGLERYDWYQRRGDKLIRYSEIYLERGEDGKIISFIDCATEERPSVKFPGCSHKFRDEGLLYDIYYNKSDYLEDWRTQRASAIAFIDDADISHRHLEGGRKAR